MEVVAQRERVEQREPELQAILQALAAYRRGEKGLGLPTDWAGLHGRIAAEFNELVAQTERSSHRLRAMDAALAAGGEPRRLPDERLMGLWLDNAASVNLLLDHTARMSERNRAVLAALQRLKRGESACRLPQDWPGMMGKLADTFNDVVDENLRMATELARLARVVGKEGKLKERAQLPAAGGFWRESVDSVNSLIADLVHPTSEAARVIGAVAQGDLSKSMALEVQGRALEGEFLRTATTINKMVRQLGTFADEVTRVAREVGTEGKLGGQAQVQGVAGTWKDLTDNVNFMASNLTSQVRNIADVTKAVAAGDLSKKITVDVKGEILELKNTINTMVDQLRAFASEVTRVAREVGVEGKLGGQAQVPGAAGTWKGLTDNVNRLAANLTTQVRAIAEVATAVTQGDLTRSIAVEALGEVAALKDTINEMIRNLKDTTQLNKEQDWLKTNLAKFSRMLQGQKDLVAVGQLILSELAPVVGAQQAEFYVLRQERGEEPRLRLMASYASRGHGAHGKEIALGEGLVGQCAFDRKKILLGCGVPDSVRIASGIAELVPLNVLVLPVVFEGQLRGVVELASLERFSSTHLAFLDQLSESIGIVINTIAANMRTEDLLAQSQSLAHELQSRQQELQQTNEELQEKARLLAHQNQEVAHKNDEVEQARQALEEKAKQLALTSKYKSEFLANMSHELRTPLNSLLILSDQLSRNPDGNLSARQIEFARTIHSSGNDLLMLINDILDLSKIESGTVAVDVSELRLSDLRTYVERTFGHVAEARNVDFRIEAGMRLPEAIVTDAKRLQQILKNLLSNAFKFTHQGQVQLSMDEVVGGWSRDHEVLGHAQHVIAFSVSDTGIGIATDKQQIIFEAFQQADGSTSRKYGGTGLGLAISRELAKLLGGEIRVTSAPGRGSTFTLYLPVHFPSTRGARRTASLQGSEAEPSAGRRRSPPPVAAAPVARAAEAAPETQHAVVAVNEAADDRHVLGAGDRVLLIVENDLAFAKCLLSAARAKGFKGLVTGGGASALDLAAEHAPAAITLDMHLRDMDGWRVLDRLKQNLDTRHIPVCVISTDDSRERAFACGAMAFIEKPIRSQDVLDALLEQLRAYASRPQRRLLVALKDAGMRQDLLDLVSQDPIEPIVVRSLDRLESALSEQSFDCVVLDEALGPVDPARLRDKLGQRALPGPMPLLLLRGPAGGPVWRSDERIAVREVRDVPGLFDAALRGMHQAAGKLPERQQLLLREIAESHRPLAGRRVLIVDDDMRNIFALATILEEHGMDIVWADNGREAINRVINDAQIDVVLMDIMMPEMDGMATMKEIRKLPQGRKLPMIAVTAKAMKGDREKCIDAGAWDYLSKPVDTQDLLAVLRAWLHPLHA